VHFDSLSLYGRLRQLQTDQPDQLAVITGPQRLTYAQLTTRIDRLIAVLVDRGIGPGDRILWLGQNSHHVLELLVASARLGAVLCPANWRQSTDELKFVLNDWNPHLVVWQEEVGDRLTGLRTSTSPNGQAIWMPVDGAGGYESVLQDQSPQQTRDAPDSSSEAVLALYTAAFSGRPAAAMLSEQGLYLQGLAHISVLETRHDDVNLVATPLFHVLAWVSLLPVLLMGGTNLFIPRPDAEEICRAIVDDGATTGPVMPQTAMQIAELNAHRGNDLSRFRSALRIRGWRDMTTPGTMPAGYGQTETTGPILIAPPGSKLGGPIQGRPSPIAQVRLVDQLGADVAPGETGELHVAGPTVTSGYWDRPEANAERLQHGWWDTGDIGRREANGIITFIGPNQRMIKTGGENVYPAEVESCLEAHPDVESAALIGRSDKTWGQLVTAVVVRRRDSDLDAQSLMADAQTKLAKYKVPREVHFVDEMPMASGAKDYAALDARFGGGNYPGTAASSSRT
jgi:acyl-CoA synthetase (AMP-forming)/AMP-acid ligase II